MTTITKTNVSRTNVVPTFWSEEHVGTVWLDTSKLKYINYYDVEAWPDVNQRLSHWGQLTGWSVPRVLEWVKSNVPPNEWNDLAALEENDVTIPEDQRKSGRTFKTLFKFDGTNWVRYQDQVYTADVAIEGIPVYRNETLEIVYYDIPIVGIPIDVESPEPSTDPTGSPAPYGIQIVVNGELSTTDYEIIPGDTTDEYLLMFAADPTIVSLDSPLGSPAATNTLEIYIDGTQVPTEGFNIIEIGDPVQYFVLTKMLEPAGGSPNELEQLIAGLDAPEPAPPAPVPVKDNLFVFVNGIELVPDRYQIISTSTEGVYAIRIENERYVKLQDKVSIVRFAPTDEEVIQAGVDAGEYKYEYEYSQVTSLDTFGTEVSTYYFWVEDKVTRSLGRPLSPAEAQKQLVNIPIPYMFFARLRPKRRVEVNGFPVDQPIRFSQSIIRGLRGIVNADRRYILRYTRDYTLRDSLSHGKSDLQLKNKHTEWELIREEQASKIRRDLWDAVTESIIGYKINDPTTRIPSLSRELYDTKYGTDTQYGLGGDRAFANGALALQAILTYLTNDQNDFRPIDINIFFQQYSFDTPTNIIAAMDRIYEAFAAIHVNKMFFSVLQDAAFSQKKKYPEIFKTSMVALHGIKPFQVGGLFDD